MPPPHSSTNPAEATPAPLAAPALTPRPSQLAWFVLVGVSAAAVHWSMAVLLVHTLQWPPLVANVLGWWVALCVSFWGHYRLTFRHSGARLTTAARRFFLVSALGFSINELSCAWLLRSGNPRFEVVLAGVLMGVALLTFVISQRWAFVAAQAPAVRAK